jgi:hypothetical protein
LEKVAQYQLVGVSIKEVGDIKYDFTGAGAPVNFNVSMSYHYFVKKA